MHTGKSYKLSQFLNWTRRDIYVLIVLGVVPVVAYQIGNIKWLGIPWTVVALLGTATAFIVWFQKRANLQPYLLDKYGATSSAAVGPGEQSAGTFLTMPKNQKSLSIATSPG